MDTLSTYEHMVLFGKEPKRPTMKDVFSKRGLFTEKKSNLNHISNNKKMVKKVHSKTREQLQKMKVGELKAMVRKYNLHNAIKGYSKMKKAGIVDLLMKHSRKAEDAENPMSSEPALPVKRGRGRPKKVAPPPLALDAPVPVKRGRGRPKRKTAGKAATRLVEQ